MKEIRVWQLEMQTLWIASQCVFPLQLQVE